MRTVDLPRVTGSPSPAFSSGAAEGGRVEIVSPPDGATVRSSIVDVVVDVHGFDLDRDQGRSILYYRGDDFVVPTTPGRSAAAGGDGSYVSVVSDRASYRWKSVPEGPEVFAVQLVGEGDIPLDPPRTASVRVEVDL